MMFSSRELYTELDEEGKTGTILIKRRSDDHAVFALTLAAAEDLAQDLVWRAEEGRNAVMQHHDLQKNPKLAETDEDVVKVRPSGPRRPRRFYRGTRLLQDEMY